MQNSTTKQLIICFLPPVAAMIRMTTMKQSQVKNEA